MHLIMIHAGPGADAFGEYRRSEASVPLSGPSQTA